MAFESLDGFSQQKNRQGKTSWNHGKKMILREYEIINDHKQKSIETIKLKYDATPWRKYSRYNIMTKQLVCFKKKSINW